MEFKFESKPVSWEQPASVHYEHEAFYRAMLPLMNIAGKFAPLGIARSFVLPRMSSPAPGAGPRPQLAFTSPRVTRHFLHCAEPPDNQSEREEFYSNLDAVVKC